MARFTQLLAAHGSILVLDAVSLRVQIGLLRAAQPPIWHDMEEEAGHGLFSGTEFVLAKAGLGIGDVESFVFCEGPGSMLGTRTIAMALRTWNTLKPRPVFTYQSLAIAAAGEWQKAKRPFAVIADARRESWHMQPVAADGTLGVLSRRLTVDLPPTELLVPANFRVWSKPPPVLAECSYDLARLIAATGEADLLRPVEAADVFQHNEPDYKKWSAQPHSAETANRK